MAKPVVPGSRIMSKRQAMHTAAVATGDGVAMGDLTQYASAAVQVTSTATSFTIVFEGNLDEATWVAVLAQDRTTGLLNTQATAAGIYLVDLTNFRDFRARISAIVPGAGSVTAVGRASSISVGNMRDVQLAASEVQIGDVEITTETGDQGADDLLDALRVFEVTGETVYNATGAAALALSTTEAGKFKLISITVRFNIAPVTSQNLTVTLNALDGAAYDTVLRSLDPSASALTSFFVDYGDGLICESGDQMDLAFTNTDVRTYGARVVTKRVN